MGTGCDRAADGAGTCPADGAAIEPVGPDPLIGQDIAGYRVVDRVGAGGMGSVYKAIMPSIGAHVAIKVIAPELAGEPGLVERFLAEARHRHHTRALHRALHRTRHRGTLAPGSARRRPSTKPAAAAGPTRAARPCRCMYSPHADGFDAARLCAPAEARPGVECECYTASHDRLDARITCPGGITMTRAGHQ